MALNTHEAELIMMFEKLYFIYICKKTDSAGIRTRYLLLDFIRGITRKGFGPKVQFF